MNKESIAKSKHTRMSSRLMCIAEEIRDAERVIDVGSDHGFIASYVLENDLAIRVIATDIHRAPAQRTKNYLEKQGFSNRSEVYCRDGISGINIHEGDWVVIAGLGGMEMIRILSQALDENEGELPKDVPFLLQPQRSAEELRIYLSENGFMIRSEKICVDRGKVYVMIRAIYTQHRYSLDLISSIIGPYIMEHRPEGTKQYLRHLFHSIEKQRRGRPELSQVTEFIRDQLEEGGNRA